MFFNTDVKQSSTSFYYAQNEEDTADGRTIAVALNDQLRIDLWTNYLTLVLSADITCVRTKCQLFAPTKSTPSFNDDNLAFGGQAGGQLTNAGAQVVTKYPGFWDRDFISRNYIPGAPELQYAAGIITDAYQTSWQDLANTQELLTVSISTPEPLTFDQVCFSSKRWKTFDPENQAITEVYSKVNSVKIQTVLATQRRRRPPRGTNPSSVP